MDRLVTADEGAGSVGITFRFLAQEPREKGDVAFRNKKARRGPALPRLCGAFGDWVGWPMEFLDS